MPGIGSITKLGRRLIQKGMRRSIGIKSEIKRLVSKRSANTAASVAEAGVKSGDRALIKTADGIAEGSIAKAGPKLLTNSGEKRISQILRGLLIQS